MADDASELVGQWNVTFQQWRWIYTFTSDGKVTWRDPVNNMTGSGRYSLLPNIVHFSWTGTTAKESWNRPVKANEQIGWYDASYGVGTTAPRKIPDEKGPHFWKDRDTGTVGSSFTAEGRFWRQEVNLGTSATVTLKHYRGLAVGLNNSAIAKLVTWAPGDDNLYVDIVPTMNGDAYLEARSGQTVVASIQVHVSSNADAAIYVDDFVGSYYSPDYRHSGGNNSKWLVLEYKDSVVIDVNIDDIHDTPSTASDGSGRIGEGGRRFPASLDKTKTPRLYAAKTRAISVMNAQYAEVLEVASAAIFFVLTISPIVAPLSGPTNTRRVPRRSLPKAVDQHVNVPPAPKPSTPKSFVNLNSAAKPPETSLGVWLDAEAQSGRMGLIKRVGGPPEVKGQASPDYHMFTTDVDNAQIANRARSPDLRGDAVIARSNNIDNILKNNVGSKSGRQADVVVVELGAGESGKITDANVRAWKLNDIQTTWPKLRRLIVVRNNGGSRYSVLDLEVR
jgi:hypothetical protein